jgi:mannose-6-phosphate isomerase-like protein (cupin superfamily)
VRVNYVTKIWGKTARVAKHPGFTVHHLVVVPKSFCSIHFHDHRFNGFFVTRGTLTIRLLDPSDKELHRVELQAGDYHEVPPGFRHQFCSEQGCEALEIYFPPDVDDEDIVRFSEGGRSE